MWYSDDALAIFERSFSVQVNVLNYLTQFIVLQTPQLKNDLLFFLCVFLSRFFDRTRGIATGIAASINYLMAFSTVKTYFNLETTLSLPGVAMFYCIAAIIGLVLLYNILPETENRSLEDIERHFSDDSKRLCDWQIPQHVKQQQ